MFCALTLCGLCIYGIVMAVLPRHYTALSNTHISQALDQLASEINGMDSPSAGGSIDRFCLQNHIMAVLTTGNSSTVYGGDDGAIYEESSFSTSVSLQFSDLPNGSVLTVVSSASTAEAITRTFVHLLPPVILLILVLSSLSAWLCSRQIVKPILRISDVSKRMARMDMTWRCGVRRADELGDLADSLNTLAQRLTLAMSKLEAANRQLQKDVDASRAMEKQRRDFFAAASHELKTPLTVLRGQLESMALGVGDYKHHEKYLPQALDTVESIEQLVREMLTISKMESGISKESFSEELLSPILASCLAEIAPLAAEKQIAVSLSCEQEDMRAPINPPLFTKALSNILSNAVRYSPPGESITVTLSPSALTVVNTGVTIPEKDLPLLFSPFYRVDPSRNRKSGGSGLGLYIVRTILHLHGFAYRLDNADHAVRFTMELHQN